MKLGKLARKAWGSDFEEKPYHGPAHVVYRGIGGVVSLGAVIPPFQGEEGATLVLVSWLEIVPAMDCKDIHQATSTRGRSLQFHVVDGEVDEEAVFEAITEATIQVERNRLILKSRERER